MVSFVPYRSAFLYKSETLLDMTDVFTSLSHARRSARLEWIIIILIAIEIVLYVMGIFHAFQLSTYDRLPGLKSR
jgi:uncharacterized Rmd1/YagE family protein